MVFAADSHWTADVKARDVGLFRGRPSDALAPQALIVFVSPLYYMTSSLIDIQLAESTVPLVVLAGVADF